MASRQQSRSSKSNGRVGADCPPIEQAVVLWDDPWPKRQLLTAKRIAQKRQGRDVRDQHDAPWWVRLKTSMRYLTPLFLFGCLLVGAFMFHRWSQDQNSAMGNTWNNLGRDQDETIYDGVAPSPTPPPIPTHIPPTSTAFLMPPQDDNSMAPPFEGVRQTATATYATVIPSQ